MTKRFKGALRLGVQKALGVVSTHYVMDFEHLATGYIIPDGDDDAKIEVMEQADTGAKSATTTLEGLFDSDLFPDAADGEEEGRNEGGGSDL